MSKAQFQQTGLPLLLLAVGLVALNAGLYTLLTAAPVPIPRLPLPYIEAFDGEPPVYRSFGGDWDVRDAQLVQINTVGLDLGTLIPVDAPADARYTLEVDLRHMSDAVGGGLIFNAQQLNSRQQSHMLRFNRDGAETFLIWGAFGDDSDFTGQGSIRVDIAPGEVARLGVAVNPETYSVLLDGEPLVESIPLVYRGGAAGLITSGSQVAFDNVAVLPVDGPAVVAEVAPEAEVAEVAAVVEVDGEALVYSDTFDSAGGVSAWTPFSGTWVFDDGALRQTDATGFDFGAGNITGLPSTYTYSVMFAHEQGQGGGVLFNMATPESKNNAHMVRYVHDDDFLTWGYFDAEGIYTGQGSVPVPNPGTETHTLTVFVTPDSYVIALDGETVTGEIPLAVTGNHIGLVSAQSVMRVARVNVTTGATVNTELTVEAVGTSGVWEITPTGTIQTAMDATDYVAGTGFAAESFALDVTITQGEGAGGGVVFHMEARDNPAGGTMVRFNPIDSVIFWGRYDAEGVFEGAGSAPVVLPEDESVDLRIVARPALFDVIVNGEIIVRDIPLASEGGWLGLVSFSGPVAFDELQLSAEVSE
ncbi:MAG: hypothetical protein AAF125_06115 [Chloroflexota bacterium]